MTNNLQGIVAGVLLGAVTVGGIAINNNDTATDYNQVDRTEQVTTKTKALNPGEGTFTYRGKETQHIGFTATSRMGGHGLPTWLTTDHKVAFMVFWEDDMKTVYNFRDRGFLDGTDSKGMVDIGDVGDDASAITFEPATFEFDGDTIRITSKNGSITELGGTKDLYEMQSAQAKELFDAYRAKQALLNDETFDQMISRLSKRICVEAEGLNYINSNGIGRAAQTVLSDFSMGPQVKARWNRMNSDLRFEHVTGAMDYDCGNLMSVVYDNDLNDSVNRATAALAFWGF